MSDTIEVRGLELLVYCGVLSEEQERRQPFRFDLDLHLDLSEAGRTDDLDKTADYGALIDRLRSTLAGERFALLERMAARVAELVFDDERIEAVTITVHKLRPPVAAHVESTGVRIHRTRAESR